MPDLWWPEAITRHLCPTPLTFTGGPAKGVLHTTEGRTYAGALAAYRAANSWPHFSLTNETGAFVAHQHVPLNRAARSLRNDPGGAETNRDHAIQAEIVGYAALADKMPRTFLSGIRRWMRWVEANAGVQRRALVFRAYPTSYGKNNGVRMTASDWDAYSGWCGHQHVPENTHGDPGAIDVLYLLDLAPPAPAPQPLPEDDVPFRYAFDGKQYTTDMVFRQHWESGGPGFAVMVANTRDLGTVTQDFHDSLTPANA